MPGSREKDFNRKKMQFQYIIFIATPLHKNTCPGVHKIYNLGRLFLDHHHYILRLSDICLGVEKKFLNK